MRVLGVDLVVLACALRVTTKKGSSTFCIAPSKYFPLELSLLLTAGRRGGSMRYLGNYGVCDLVDEKLQESELKII